MIRRSCQWTSTPRTIDNRFQEFRSPRLQSESNESLDSVTNSISPAKGFGNMVTSSSSKLRKSFETTKTMAQALRSAMMSSLNSSAVIVLKLSMSVFNVRSFSGRLRTAERISTARGSRNSRTESTWKKLSNFSRNQLVSTYRAETARETVTCISRCFSNGSDALDIRYCLSALGEKIERNSTELLLKESRKYIS